MSDPEEIVACTECWTHVGDLSDDAKDGRPLCHHCLEFLNRARYASEHGLPIFSAGETERDVSLCEDFVWVKLNKRLGFKRR